MTARFRLRFLLQEVEIRPGDTLIGRSPVCEVSIEDPLVSREHARIHLEGDEAWLEDLGSRNGTAVDGVRVSQGGRVKLRDGARIRIGTQELVFSVLDVPKQSASRTTGFMTRCAGCSTPYPAEGVACPVCGSAERADEDTLSGASEAARNWTLQLVIEVIDRARQSERIPEVERLLRRARANVESRLASGLDLDPRQLEAVSEAAAWLASRGMAEPWARWSLDIHRVAGGLPTTRTSSLLASLNAEQRGAMADSLERLLQAVEAHGGIPAAEQQRFVALSSLRA